MSSCDSESAIVVGDKVTGCHLLHIEGYSHSKELVIGRRIESQPFTVGGRVWRIWYYPSGARQSHADYLSIFIVLADTIAEPVNAQAKFILLDQSGNPAVPAHARATRLNEFAGGGTGCGFNDFIKREFLEESEHLKDDCFKIRCDVSIVKKLHAEARGDAAAPTPVLAPPSDLHRHLGDLLVATYGADVMFQVAGETFSAHRNVLAARSPVFKAQLFGALRESSDDAGLCVRVDDMLAPVFEALLNFVYTDSVPETKSHEDVLMAQHLLEAADRYDLQRLKLICEEKLCRHIDASTANHVGVG
ncbi:hypothetical protein ACP70R_015690 [Stipagrostis hirtigluma subsp. patula]